MEIRLFCALGFSTGMLVKQMNKAAEEMGREDIHIEACGQGAMNACTAVADVVLLSPQLAYTKNSTETLFGAYGTPVGVIPMQDYGTMNGKKVLEYALGLVEKKNEAE